MAGHQSVIWQGRSGIQYDYEVYDPAGNWNDVPGNYIFARLDQSGVWVALYVGETRSFNGRFSSHERWPCATRHGATHVHAHVNSTIAARREEEADLLAILNPPCND